MFHSYPILSNEEVDGILHQLDNHQWKEGRARTEELTGTVKQNLEIIDSDSSVAKALLLHIGEKVMSNPSLQLDHLAHLSHAPKFNLYKNGGTYKRHTDSPMMGRSRSDLSCTVFLSEPDSYTGGELCIEDQHGGVHKHKGPRGSVVVYECGMPHWVTPVTEGERICAITWIQSRIRDPKKRWLLSSFRKMLAEMEVEIPENEKVEDWFVTGGTLHSELLRMWME